MIRTTTAAPADPRWLVAQRWENLLFAHWRVDPAALRRVLPVGIEPDVHEGSAWLGIVAFVMVETRAPFAPAWSALAPIPELNVRTYVRIGGIPAVWFLSLDATSPLFVSMGRALYGLRYRLTPMLVGTNGGRIYFLSAGEHAFAAAYAPTGPARPPEPGSLAHFLVERYRLFSLRAGRLVTAVVEHEPWPLQPAEARIELNTMAPPGLEYAGQPLLLHFSSCVHARISVPYSIGTVSADEGRARSRRSRSGAARPRRIAHVDRAELPADAA